MTSLKAIRTIVCSEALYSVLKPGKFSGCDPSQVVTQHNILSDNLHIMHNNHICLEGSFWVIAPRYRFMLAY